MKAYLLNPPFLPRFSREQRSPAVTRSGTLYYPMWLSYGAGALEQAGFEVSLVDGVTRGWTSGDVEDWVRQGEPGLVVLQTSTPSIHRDLEHAEGIRRVAPEARILLVGPHVSALPEETLARSPAPDAVAVGEFEMTLVEAAQRASRGEGLDGVPGLVYRQDGEIRRNPPRPLMEDLDRLPFVSSVYARHLRYTDYFYSIARYPEVEIVTGRGCVHRCDFCVYPQTMFGHRMRLRSVENVADEFTFIRETFPDVKEVFIEDDTLTVDQERCRELCRLLIERGTPVGWTANSRADVDFETLRLMRQAGCRLLCVGFESGDQNLLDSMNKANTLEKARGFVRAARRAGVMVHGCFMVGNPGETRESMQATLRFAQSLNTDTAQFFPVMVYPGTRTYDWTRRQGYLTTEDYRRWLTEEGLHNCVVDLPDLPARELVAFCDQARREYYLRPRYMGRKLLQMIRRPEEIRRTLKSLRTFLPHLVRGSFASRDSCPKSS